MRVGTAVADDMAHVHSIGRWLFIFWTILLIGDRPIQGKENYHLYACMHIILKTSNARPTAPLYPGKKIDVNPFCIFNLKSWYEYLLIISSYQLQIDLGIPYAWVTRV